MGWRTLLQWLKAFEGDLKFVAVTELGGILQDVDCCCQSCLACNMQERELTAQERYYTHD